MSRLSRRQSLLVVATATLALLAPAAAFAGKKPPKKRKSDLISGTAIDEKTGDPVTGAMIEIYPVDPQSKGADVTIYTDLVGVDTTSPTGAWSIDALSSPAAFLEFGILRSWSYQVVVTAPGYYQLRDEFEFKKGKVEFKLELSPKLADVVDDTGVVQESGEQKFMSRGKVVRGN